MTPHSSSSSVAVLAVAAAATVASVVLAAVVSSRLRRHVLLKAKLPKLQWLAGRFAVVRLPAGTDAVAALALRRPASASLPFFSLTHTAEETSVVLQQQQLGAKLPGGVEVERNWACFKVEGPLDFALVGILSRISEALAAAAVPLFSVSTFDTDYVLVKGEHKAAATRALVARGYTMLEA